ncbi:MAG TPA: hypothetical protein VNF74_13890 [Terriglobales bacterium]|nr:hypothetical protein [Terriglobales bacterium]
MSQKQEKRTKAEADGLVAAYEGSGMTRRKFCAGVGMSPHTLDYYRRQRGRIGAAGAARPAAAGEPRWVEVRAEEPRRGAPLALVLSDGTRIEAPVGFDGETLRRMLDVLRGR